MFCSKCGNVLDSSATFCSRCGQVNSAQPVQQPVYQQPVYQQPVQQPVYQQPVYQQPVQQPVYQQPVQQPVYQQPMQQSVYQQPVQQPVYQQPVQQPVYQQPTYQQPVQQPAKPALPMRWFKFLIYFGLFAGAIINLISGITLLTGSAYGEEKELVYRMYSGLQSLEMAVGAILILLAVIGIAARFALAGYKKSGPVLLILLYIGGVVSNLVYVFGLPSILPELIMQNMDMTSYYTSIASSLVFTIINAVYFKKRSHLFKK